jgi:hypothetical protein
VTGSRVFNVAPRRPKQPRPPRIILNPVDRLPGQAGLLRNPRDPHGLLCQQGARMIELGASEARLASEVDTLVTPLGVIDAGPLGGLRGFGLGLTVAAMNAISASRRSALRP